LALATLVGMPLIAIIVDHYSDEQVNLAASVAGPMPVIKQMLYGLLAGVASAGAAYALISAKFMRHISSHYTAILGHFNLAWHEILLISLCAGVGEELLFRGAIQPFLGIALTSILFVGIHGYYSFRSWQISIYGATMTIIIAAIGWMAITCGLISAIVAHTIIDVVLLHRMQVDAQRNNIPPAFGPDDVNQPT
ncbi:MAG: CPBP family intramembrane metalloprotease, partial [Flavobacteriales bacterium]|nr:CPBP family intramembrane metalloprotease [Flavobacteriales bacterium]